MSTDTQNTPESEILEPGASTTHFGYKTVREEDKVDMVRGVFNNVASK